MNFLSRALCCTIGIAGLFVQARAEGLFAAQIGFAWPEALASAAPSGDAELQYGAIVDQKLAYGVALDFLWNVQTTTAQTPGGHFTTISDQQAYMFPVMALSSSIPCPTSSFTRWPISISAIIR